MDRRSFHVNHPIRSLYVASSLRRGRLRGPSFLGQPRRRLPPGGLGADSWLQGVAAEMNLSETAFVVRVEDGYRLRWFTPTVEVALCGHATLAPAHILWQEGHIARDETIRFHTQSGLLQAVRHGEEIELDFPLQPAQTAEAPAKLLEALGISPRYVGRNGLDYLVEVEAESTVRGLKPNFSLLRTIPVRGVIVTSRSSNPAYDFVSRFFAPARASTRIPLPARPIAAWELFGRNGSGRTSSSPIKPRPGVEWFAFEYKVSERFLAAGHS